MHDPVAAIRRFSRFYTRRLGLLHEGLLGARLTLPEARLIWELADRGTATATALATALDLDAGYLSRLLRGLEERGLVARRTSAADARQHLLSLTTAGKDEFAALDGRSRAEVAALIAGLSEADRARLVAALDTTERLLAGDGGAPVTLRPHRPGDLGWVVHRHGALYAAEYGFDSTFEGLVAGIAAEFLRGHDPAREACWIAERDGAALGAVMLVRQSDQVAKLRLLYVEPASRGAGIGRMLVGECLRFARHAGYARVTLWTNDVLTAARRIYEGAGFRLVATEPHERFGQRMVGETWEIDLH
jgi:DNA-binding MarR family transcriptional regulator/ribosomal protein S18 acetylase RimI-like enzyme